MNWEDLIKLVLIGLNDATQLEALLTAGRAKGGVTDADVKVILDQFDAHRAKTAADIDAMPDDPA